MQVVYLRLSRSQHTPIMSTGIYSTVGGESWAATTTGDAAMNRRFPLLSI
jgi:hypothetical protein